MTVEISPLLRQTIVELAQRNDVRSISCPFEDSELWRSLVAIQVQRAKTMGVSPEQALRLSGPDSGLPGIAPEDWGGDIHIPYEGAASGDLFILPDWWNFFPDNAQAGGSLMSACGGRPCHLVLTAVDYGELDSAHRKVIGDWVLYEAKDH